MARRACSAGPCRACRPRWSPTSRWAGRRPRCSPSSATGRRGRGAGRAVAERLAARPAWLTDLTGEVLSSIATVEVCATRAQLEERYVVLAPAYLDHAAACDARPPPCSCRGSAACCGASSRAGSATGVPARRPGDGPREGLAPPAVDSVRGSDGRAALCLKTGHARRPAAHEPLHSRGDCTIVTIVTAPPGVVRRARGATRGGAMEAGARRRDRKGGPASGRAGGESCF